jgi:hypothetical protein
MEQYDADGNEIKVDEQTEKDRQAAFEAISKKAILINLSRKQISNMPFDVNTSNDVAKLLNVTDSNMIQVRKLLFNPDHLAKIRSLINDALLMIWNHTRPWDNIGYRLLPMAYYDDFNETFGKIKDEFEEAVREFTDNYDSYVKESKKVLGKAFNKNDYPDRTQLNQFFNLQVHTSKFPDIDDIRLNLSGPELVAMQNGLTEKYDDILKSSIDELCKLVKQEQRDPGEVARLMMVIEKLNAEDNAEITMQLEEIKEKLGGKLPSDLLDDDESMMVIDDVIEEAKEDGAEDEIDELMDDYL